MRRLRIGLRASAIVAIALALAPFQWLAVLAGGRLAGAIPVFFHRSAMRIIGLRITARGRPSPARPLLIAANHTSWLDVSVIGSALPAAFVARADMRGWAGVNVLAWLQRSIFVDRTRRTASGAAASELGARLAAGEAIVIFAEGTTSDGNRVLRYRTALFGAVRNGAANGTKITVQPLCIAYTARHGVPLGRHERAALAWHGDMELAPHLLDVIGGEPVDAALIWGETIVVDGGADRKMLANDLESWARSALAEVLTGRCDPADRPQPQAPTYSQIATNPVDKAT